MNRNVESHFSKLPAADIKRSIFDRSFTHKTSLNVGDLVPFFIDEVLPGDTFKVTTSKVIRLQTLLTPVMDNLYLDTYYFFVPNRLIWSHWKEFQGENTSSAWASPVIYTIPTIAAPANGFDVGTIADYMGLPPGTTWNATDHRAPSALPFRAYAMICDQFFRDENLTYPLVIPTGDSNQTGSNGSSYVTDVANGGKPFRVAKYHDYFTSALPAPQKGTAVSFDILGGSTAPVYADVTPHNRAANPLQYKILTGSPTPNTTYPTAFHVNSDGQTGYEQGILGTAESGAAMSFSPSNLYADLSSISVGNFTINELRLAFQLQKYLEKNARGGSRYTEILRSHFGVTSPDSRLQRPEYLGGNRVPVSVHEITNTAQSSADFLGDLGAKSVTKDIHADFNHSFTEHGYVLGVMCLRYDHSYPQGIERFWSRHSVTDFYLPVFANIGEQPVYKSEIYATSTTMNDRSVWGYQEAWADYRYKPDRVSGEMRPGVPNTLGSWHFSDFYTVAPTLSDAWIREDRTNVDRTLAVTSAVANQAFCDIYVKNICTRPMPLYSIPGLIDHH